MIAVDVNGADDPRAAAEGAASSGVDVLIFGPAEQLAGIENVVDAPVSIAKATDPARAARSTPDASIVQAARAVAEGRADALVAGGSTGTALAAGLFNVKRAKGIHRPALALPLPIPGAPVTLLDVGANEICRPEHLVQFAYMGAALAQSVLGVERPRVGLLSNGTEAAKGREEIVAAHERLRGMPGFVGNVEGFALTEGIADVIVTDGFTGNVVLKTLEGGVSFVVRTFLAAMGSTEEARQATDTLLPVLAPIYTELDPDTYGGAMLLGVKGVCIISHGSSSARALVNAVRVGREMADAGLVDHLRAAVGSAAK